MICIKRETEGGMEILTVKDASERWGISTRRITALCEQGRIEGAIKASGVWILPANAKKPKDARIRNGKYIHWRKSAGMISSDFEKNLKNLRGTVEVESVKITETSVRNLARLASGETTCPELVNEIIEKYTRL